MNEAETRADYIDPALKAAGWGVAEGSRILREYPITPGRIEGYGHRGKPLTADYVLVHRNRKLAVIEAKARDKPLTEGVGQAKDYAGKMDVRFAVVPFEDKGGSHPSRYYQDIAVERVMEAIAADKQRILLTLATGTGKTFIAFQVAGKLFHSRWNLSREPSRRPRILFLADRNILANQAYNAFSAFPEDAMVRISPADISKKGKVPKNGSLFFTIFQTFMSGTDGGGEPAPYFGEYPPDFFDFIVIDECHRGGANDESNWRGILDYFAPAVQLGMTATPKRKDNADTYAYFGDPVYSFLPGHYVPPLRVNTELSPLQRDLLAIVARLGPSSLSAIRAELVSPIPERTVQNNLVLLRSLRLVESHGRARGARWNLPRA